jgi:hypothetical protein
MHRHPRCAEHRSMTVVPRWEWRMFDAGIVPGDSAFAGLTPDRVEESVAGRDHARRVVTVSRSR